MLGSSVVMKAAKKGYKRYGVPGAVVAGAGTLLGLRFVKRRFLSGNKSDGDDGSDTDLGDVADSVTDSSSSSN